MAPLMERTKSVERERTAPLPTFATPFAPFTLALPQDWIRAPFVSRLDSDLPRLSIFPKVQVLYTSTLRLTTTNVFLHPIVRRQVQLVRRCSHVPIRV